MTTEPLTRPTRTPWHLWVVGVLALLWNAFGAFDYSMTQSQNPAYTAGFPPEQIAFLAAMPPIVKSAWAAGVWGGVAGSVLLLLRRRLAVWVYLASIVGVITLDVHNYVLSNGIAVAGGAAALLLPAVVVVVALGLLAYATAMRARGVLA